MFIKKLWKYNKPYTILVIGFIALYFFINFKQGIIIAPAYQYGMFSGAFTNNDTQTVLKIIVNSTDTLDFNKLSYVQSDIITYYLEKTPYLNESNNNTYKTVKKVFTKLGIGSIITEDKNNCHINTLQFEKKFKLTLEKVTHTKIESVKVYTQQYIYNGKQLAPTPNTKLIYLFNGT